MGIERRKASAIGLRQLFHKQLDHLSSLLERRLAERETARHRAFVEEGAVEVVVDGTNSLLRVVSGYKARLRKSVRKMLTHIDGLVLQLPEPIEVSGKHFLHDPRVNAFFVNVDAVRNIFSCSHDLQTFFSDPLFNSRSHVFAVMFMNMVEKEVLGTAMVGGMMRQDVRKTTISFTDHKIMQPSETEAQVRESLERFLFESVVEYVNYRLARLGVGEVGGGPCADLAQSNGGEPPNMKDPEVYLQYLCKALESPRELLQLEASTIRVNRIGEKVADDSRQVANDLSLNEIRLGRHGHEVVALVTFPRDEMISRDELLRRASAHLQH